MDAVFDEDALFERFKARLLKDPAVLKVIAQQPEIRVELRPETITMDGKTLPGRIARLVADGFFQIPRRHVDAKRELERTGPAVHNGNLTREIKSLVQKGFLTDEAAGYAAVPAMKVNIVEVRDHA